MTTRLSDIDADTNADQDPAAAAPPALDGRSAEKSWPAPVALLTAAILPATTARRTQHCSLSVAWLVHFIAGLLILLAILLLAAFAEVVHQYRDFLPALQRTIADIVDEAARAPRTATTLTLVVTVVVEVAFLALAGVLMPWGARDEPLRSSYASALRRTWLHTAAIIPALLFVATTGILLSQLQTDFNRRRHQAVTADVGPAPRPPAPGEPGYTEKMQEYTAEAAEWRRDVAATMGRFLAHPLTAFLARHDEELTIMLCFTAALWWLCTLLRSIGAPRHVIPLARPPTCDRCGYNLTTMPLDARCPECGEPVAQSLGPGVRTGPPWCHRAGTTTLPAWWQTATLAIRRPDQLGRRLRTLDPGTEHRRYFAIHLPIIFLIGAVGLIGGAVADEGAGGVFEDPWMIMFIATTFGIACVAGTILVHGLAAGLVGGSLSRTAGRNLLPAANRTVCYLAPYLAIWAAVGASSAIGAILLEKTWYFRAFAEWVDVFREPLAFFLWLFINLAAGVHFLTLLWRATSAARFANR